MHDECGHWYGSRGAFNYRRLRRESFAILCGCDCHSSCPVTNEKNPVGDQAWRRSCTCPGAGAMRRMIDEFGTLPFGVRDFREMWAKSRKELQSRRGRLRRLRRAPLARTCGRTDRRPESEAPCQQPDKRGQRGEHDH
jgi:hypothetical protein